MVVEGEELTLYNRQLSWKPAVTLVSIRAYLRSADVGKARSERVGDGWIAGECVSNRGSGDWIVTGLDTSQVG